MFTAVDEPRIMLCSFAFGGIAGFIYELFYVFLLPVKNRAVRQIIVIIWWVVVAFLFVFFNYFFRLGNFRVYKLALILVGLAFYFKSFHKIIAFFLNKVYNKCVSYLKKKRAKKVKNDRAKKEKGTFGAHIRRNNAFYNIGINFSLPISKRSAKVQRNKKVG